MVFPFLWHQQISSKFHQPSFQKTKHISTKGHYIVILLLIAVFFQDSDFQSYLILSSFSWVLKTQLFWKWDKQKEHPFGFKRFVITPKEVQVLLRVSVRIPRCDVAGFLLQAKSDWLNHSTVAFLSRVSGLFRISSWKTVHISYPLTIKRNSAVGYKLAKRHPTTISFSLSFLE